MKMKPKTLINLMIASVISGIFKLLYLFPFVYIPWIIIAIPFLPLVTLFIILFLKMLKSYVKTIIAFFTETQGEKK